MAAHTDNVPKWVRIAVGILALLTLIYGIMCYVDVNILFNPGAGLDFTNASISHAGHEYAARNLAIGLALVFVTLIKGAPEALTILTLVRALIEIQTIILSVVERNITAMLLLPVALLVLEIMIVKTLIGVIKKEEAEANSR